MKNLKKKIRAYALRNAIAHDGKANPGSVIAALFHDGLKKSDAKKVMPDIQKVIKEIGKLKPEEQQSEFAKLGKTTSERKIRVGLPVLPKIPRKGVIMRIAPSASGPLHVGHALVAGLNIAYVKKYGGKFIVRIEDTNPENIDPKAYKLIEEDAKWLFPKSKIVIQSDRIRTYYKYAEKLIKSNSSYVCTCSAEDFREFSTNKKECPCRAKDIKENMVRWKKMLDKKGKGYNVGGAVLRFRSNMQDPNPAMRDFPLARINTTTHPRARHNFRVWPLMNLSVSVDDIEMRMTHIIRGKDHRDNAKRQMLIYKALGKKYPWTAFMGIVHFKGMELSTTKMREGIKAGKYKNWSDKKLPTLVSLRKQGYKPEAFIKFSERISLGENDKIIDKKEYFILLDGFNKT